MKFEPCGESLLLASRQILNQSCTYNSPHSLSLIQTVFRLSKENRTSILHSEKSELIFCEIFFSLKNVYVKLESKISNTLS